MNTFVCAKCGCNLLTYSKYTKCRMGENCPRYGDYLVFVHSDMSGKVTDGTGMHRRAQERVSRVI